MPAPIAFSQIQDALPAGSFLRDYLRWGATQTDAALIFHVGLCLGMLSGLVPSTYSVQVGRGLPVFPQIMSVIVGPSGVSRKSTAIRLMLRLFRAVSAERIGDHPDSAEGFHEGLVQTPQQTLIYTELGEFLAKTRAGMRQENLKVVFTQATDGEPMQRRLAQSVSVVEAPRFSLMGGVSTVYLNEYSTRSDWSGGFYSRLTMWVGKQEHSPASLCHIDKQEAFSDLEIRLKAAFGRAVSSPVGLTAEGQEFFDAWAMKQDLIAKDPKTPEPLRGALSRAQEQVIKIALLNAWIDGRAKDIPWALGIQDLKVGAILAQASLDCVLYLITNASSTLHQQQRRRVLELLDSGPMALPAIARDLQIKSRDLDHLLNSILKEGLMLQMPENANGIPHFTLRNLSEAKRFEDIANRAPDLISLTGGVPVPATVIPIRRKQVSTVPVSTTPSPATVASQEDWEKEEAEERRKWCHEEVTPSRDLMDDGEEMG